MKNATAMRLGFDKKKDATAHTVYKPVIIEKQIDRLEDGVWYLHFSADVLGGDESRIDYQINVDRSSPKDFSIHEVSRADQSIPEVIFMLSATDTVSGIDHYSFSVDGGQHIDWKDDGTHQFHYRAPLPGTHELVAMVFDKAGNSLSEKLSFEVTYIAPPRLTIPHQSFKEGSNLVLSVESVPHATVSISLLHDGDPAITENTTTDDKGQVNFSSATKLLPGAYKVSAVAVAENGATSKKSDDSTFSVSISYIALISRHPLIPVVVIVFALFLFFAWRAFKNYSSGDEEDYLEEDENEDETDEYVEDDEYVEEVDISLPAPSSNGQVILQPRKQATKLTPPPTRL
jgi:hypothetical protein